MDRKHLLITGVVVAVLGALIYLQFRAWESFDWSKFLAETGRVDKLFILAGILLTYFAYVLRAVRWKIFLRPSRPDVTAVQLLSPTIVGFTGLSLLGRPGEFIRPYLIARRTNLPISSQMAVWTVERIFDIGAFTLLLVLAAFFSPGGHRPEIDSALQKTALFLGVIVTVLTIGAIAIARSGEGIAVWVERRLPSHFGERLALRVREFRLGLDTIHGLGSFLQLIVVSVLMWGVIALAYRAVTHSYGDATLTIPQNQLFLLMAASMFGSLVQLPGVGGGSQLATITTLNRVFAVKPELAASCGIMLWLVTFMSVIPLGLLLAHNARLSLRKLSDESQQAEEAVKPESLSA
jgi:glycosyltransferase 2 family protein